MSAILNRLYNFHWVVPSEAARAAQPYLGFYRRFLTDKGLKSVINLRSAHPELGWWRYETRVCLRNGLAHFDVSLNSRRLPPRQVLASLIAAFDEAPKPFVIKCSGGQDRASFAAALYVLHRSGWAAAPEALAQFAAFPYLHVPRRTQRWLPRFFEYAALRSHGAPVGTWIRDAYDRADLVAWLDAKGLERSYAGLLEF